MARPRLASQRFLCQFLHLRRRLLQPESHVHLAVHCGGGTEVLLHLLALACAPVELAETKVAVGDERAHAELSGELNSLTEIPGAQGRVSRSCRERGR